MPSYITCSDMFDWAFSKNLPKSLIYGGWAGLQQAGWLSNPCSQFGAGPDQEHRAALQREEDRAAARLHPDAQSERPFGPASQRPRDLLQSGELQQRWRENGTNYMRMGSTAFAACCLLLLCFLSHPDMWLINQDPNSPETPLRRTPDLDGDAVAPRLVLQVRNTMSLSL